MRSPHPDPQTLERFAVGEMPAGELAEIERHLEVCSGCRDRVDKAVGLLGQPLIDWLSRGYDDALDRAVRRAAEQLAGLRRESRSADDLLGELVREPAPGRQRKIRDDERFHSLPLCELLRTRSKRDWFSDPAAALTWAELAVGIAERLDPRRYGAMLVEDAQAISWGYLGNALRITSDLWQADRALQRAWSHRRQGSGDLYTETELLGFTTSLRRQQERFVEAVKLADRAAALYRSVHETHLEGSALITKGVALGEDGRHRDAVAAIRSGLSRIDAIKEPRLLFIGKHDLSAYLLDDGQHAEAGQVLEELRSLDRETTDMTLRARFLWLQGYFAQCLGQLAAVETHLSAAREIFLELGLGAYAFDVSLAMAETYVRAGQSRRAREILSEVIPLGEALGLRQESLAARLLYEQAARA